MLSHQKIRTIFSVKPKIIFAIALLATWHSVAFAQTGLSQSAGRFYATAYGKWSVYTVSNTNAGAGSVSVDSAYPTLSSTEATIYGPFERVPLISVQIDSGPQQEVVALTAVNGCGFNAPYGQCTLFGTFTKTHGNGARITSGTAGLQDAINIANSYGGGVVVVDQAWASLGGTTQMISAVTGTSSVSIEDNRGIGGTGTVVYTWNGSSYVIRMGGSASCSVGNALAEYLVSGTVVSCNTNILIGTGENTIAMGDNSSVSNAAPSQMKIGSLNGVPSIGFNGPLSAILVAANLGQPNGVASLNGSSVLPIAQEVTNTTNCDGTHAILGNQTCGTLSSSLPSTSTNQVLAGPSAYGAAAATAAGRALVAQDLPTLPCPLDNAICTSSVDANGNPNFLATVASLALPINGGTTPLTAFIAGKYQSLNTNITITLPASPTGIYFIYVNQDLANANLGTADFGSTNIAPIYAKTAPVKLAAATSSNPQLWFDLSTNTMRSNTAGTGGTFNAVSTIVLGAVDNTGTQIDQVLCEPFRLDPNTRYRIFKDASDGAQTVTSTMNKNGEYHYSAFEMTGGSYSPSATPYANVVFSQNVVILMPGTTFGGTGQGLGGPSPGTGNGGNSSSGGFGGSGGGGGGGTGKNGGTGGSRTSPYSFSSVLGGGTSGSAGANNGGAGGAANLGTNIPTSGASFFLGCMGSAGAGGGGDGTNTGGGGGAAGSYEHIIAPAVLIAGTAKVQADGGTPNTPAAGNVGGGGGGGGGCAFIDAGYVNGTTANVTANGASGGLHFGTTVGDGGAGGNGIVKIQSIL